MKRYDIGADRYGWPEMRERSTGNYYLVSDVEREMIPRPDAEEARRLLKDLMEACDNWAFSEITEQELDAKANTVLALMGVEG